MPKKGGIGQFVDLKGGWQERGGVFEGVLITQCPLCAKVRICQNMSSIIKSHNKKAINKDVKELKLCNFRVKTECSVMVNVKSPT